MVDWTITLHAALCDSEVAELGATASDHGISDFAVTKNRRIISAETERDDDSLLWITQWVADALYEVEVIAQIKEERIYWPEFGTEEEFRIEIDFDGAND